MPFAKVGATMVSINIYWSAILITRHITLN